MLCGCVCQRGRASHCRIIRIIRQGCKPSPPTDTFLSAVMKFCPSLWSPFSHGTRCLLFGSGAELALNSLPGISYSSSETVEYLLPSLYLACWYILDWHIDSRTLLGLDMYKIQKFCSVRCFTGVPNFCRRQESWSTVRSRYLIIFFILI